MRHVGGDAGIGEQVREPAPAEGGFERNLQWLVVQFSKHAQQLVRSSGDPAAEDRCPTLIQGHDVCGLAMKVHSDVDHDRASFPVACPSRR
jgi:hypothetical protein